MTRLIKKYKNRRLYDTEISQYITVETLQRYVLDSLDFRVEDSVSKEDLTNATLLQIFVEMEAGPSQFLSKDMLRQLICLAHHPMNESLRAMMGQMIASLDTHAEANPYLKNYSQATDAWNKQMQQFIQQWQTIFPK